MSTAIRQVATGAGVLGVVATVLAVAPLDNPLACVGLLLVGVGVFTEARRRAGSKAA